MKTKKHIIQKESCPIKGVLTLTCITDTVSTGTHSHTFTTQQTKALPMQSFLSFQEIIFQHIFSYINRDSFTFLNEEEDLIWVHSADHMTHMSELFNNLIRFHIDTGQYQHVCKYTPLLLSVNCCCDGQEQFHETCARTWHLTLWIFYSHNLIVPPHHYKSILYGPNFQPLVTAGFLLMFCPQSVGCMDFIPKRHSFHK